MQDEAILYTFAPSHYCEKARWALDLAALAYREEAWAPGLHTLLARRLAPKTTVPILRTEDACIQGSGAIIDWIEAQGRAPWRMPQDDASRAESKCLEAHADAVTGVAVRRFAYAISLSSASNAVARNLHDGISVWQKPLARLMWPVTRAIMIRGLRAAPTDIAPAKEEVDRELTRLDELLAGGRRFLVGDRLSRADIAVASLIAPIARPPEHPVYRNGREAPAFVDAIAPWRTRPSILWARAIYQDFRSKRS